MNLVLRTALPRWVGMAALLVGDGADVRDVSAALRHELAADLQGLTEAEQAEVDHQIRIVMGLFRSAMLAACAETH